VRARGSSAPGDDVWAAAVIAYIAWSGRHPFADVASGTYDPQRALSGQLDWPPGIIAGDPWRRLLGDVLLGAGVWERASAEPRRWPRRWGASPASWRRRSRTRTRPRGTGWSLRGGACCW